MRLKGQMLLAGTALLADLFLLAGLGSMLRDRMLQDNMLRDRMPESAAVLPVSAEEKTAAITFDDGPSAKYTGLLLDGLKERGIRASFFLVGACIEGNEALVERMAAEGHLVGVHCLYHTDLTKEKAETAVSGLEETREMIREITGEAPEYIRPPFGNWSGELEELASMEPVFWSVDSLDWKLKNTEAIVSRVIKDTESGDIILMHDEFAASVDAALRVIDILTAKGYTFVTVDELMID